MEIMQQKEVAKWLRVTTITIRDWEHKGLPRHTTPGGRPFYVREEIEAWIEAQAVTQPSEWKRANTPEPKDKRANLERNCGND